MPEVDAKRIGIIGLSYGGKWSMFASCLDERFACAVWSDPGIVFNEKDSNVNYWEPWYLGFDPKQKRKPGVPSPTNPPPACRFHTRCPKAQDGKCNVDEPLLEVKEGGNIAACHFPLTDEEIAARVPTAAA